MLSLFAAYAALIAQSYPWKSRLLTIISIFDASLTSAPVYVNNSLSHCRQTSTHGQSMSLRIRRVSRNYILHNRSTTSAWFARTASCLRFPHKGVAKSRLQGHAPPRREHAHDGDTFAPFCQALRTESCFICTRRIHQSGFYITWYFLLPFPLNFFDASTFFFTNNKNFVDNIFRLFFGIVLPVLSWQTFHCFFGCGWQTFFRFPNEFINIQNTLKILSFLPYN